jgi:hypothetical protein
MALANLPAELIAQICDHLVAPADVAALRASCTALRAKGPCLTTAIVSAHWEQLPTREAALIKRFDRLHTLQLCGGAPTLIENTAADLVEACAPTVRRVLILGHWADAILPRHVAHPFWAAIRSCPHLVDLVVNGAVTAIGAVERGVHELAIPGSLRALTVTGLELPGSKHWGRWIVRIARLTHLALVSCTGLVWDFDRLANLRVLLLDGTLLTFKDLERLPGKLDVLSLHNCPVLLMHSTGHERALHLARLAPNLARVYRGANTHQTAIAAGVTMTEHSFICRHTKALDGAPFIASPVKHDPHPTVPYVRLR